MKSFDEALDKCSTLNKQIFIIGGSKVYLEALKNKNCKTLYISQISNIDFKCDVFFPFEYLNHYKIIKYEQLKDEMEYDYMICERINNTEEYQYLNLIKDILENGILREDRTGIGRISKFGCSMRFNLENSTLPLLTTKKVSFYNIVHELLWMISGNTDSKILEEKGVNIWKGNSSREYLDKNNLSHLETGDCGAIYGFQWRHFGEKYINCKSEYKGFDQILECIKLIKEEPNSTRIIISGWNPSQLKEQVLPACHTLYQFFVNKDKLSCMVYLRSNDIGLGCPYNICSASLLTYMFAEVCDLKPYELIYNIGDAHIYSNTVEQLNEQIKREPYEFPKIHFKRKVNNIFDFKYEDFNLINYKCHTKLKMEMAV